MTLNGNAESINGYNTKIKNGEAANAQDVKAVIPPIGAVIGWHKTFDSADSGTTDGTTSNKLVDTSQNFTTTCTAFMIIHNTTDDTWAYITAVDSASQLSLSADIMVSGENYTIYSTPALPDGWLECDGSVISDSDSPYNGATLPDLNSTQRFIRGSDTSGTTGGADSVSHTHTMTSAYKAEVNAGNVGHAVNPLTTGDASDTENMPAFMEMVWIMRVK